MGMTVIGVATIVVASIGLGLALVGLVSAMLVLGLDARQMITQSRVDAETLRTLALPTLAVVLFAAMDVLLLLSGIRILQLSPRGRTYSLIWAGLALIAGVIDSGWIAWHSDGIEILLLPFALLLPAYGVLLIVLFRQSHWKQAFAR
jgi:hypothetical protein